MCVMQQLLSTPWEHDTFGVLLRALQCSRAESKTTLEAAAALSLPRYPFVVHAADAALVSMVTLFRSNYRHTAFRRFLSRYSSRDMYRRAARGGRGAAPQADQPLASVRNGVLAWPGPQGGTVRGVLVLYLVTGPPSDGAKGPWGAPGHALRGEGCGLQSADSDVLFWRERGAGGDDKEESPGASSGVGETCGVVCVRRTWLPRRPAPQAGGARARGSGGRAVREDAGQGKGPGNEAGGQCGDADGTAGVLWVRLRLCLQTSGEEPPLQAHSGSEGDREGPSGSGGNGRGGALGEGAGGARRLGGQRWVVEPVAMSEGDDDVIEGDVGADGNGRQAGVLGEAVTEAERRNVLMAGMLDVMIS